ncbi:MAG: phosphodiester glycosidase family protein [Anaerolineae bacterium]|nr:phosphodiester glycosidase family protein [Anaerolineae bacterium]
MAYLLLLLGIVLGLAAFWLGRRGRNTRRVRYGVAAALITLLAVAALISGGYEFWRTHLPIPPNWSEDIFQGVTYIRDVRDEPRPLVIHIARIDLHAAGVELVVTPPDSSGGMDVLARTTSGFLAEFGVQVAINASYFEPWWSRALWDYYPHVGDPARVYGLAAAGGVTYGEPAEGFPSLYVTRDLVASIGTLPDGEVYNAVSGNHSLLEDGEMPDFTPNDYQAALHPRTAVALDRSGRILLLVVVDGRQPNYSEGVTLPELAEIIRQYNGYDALNLDGGGSSTLVVQGTDGQPRILNSSIDNNIPGRERPVAVQLGVRALPLAEG